MTYEATENDWGFEVWADAILEDFPEGGIKKEAPPPAKIPKGGAPPPKGGSAPPKSAGKTPKPP